jgi:hypothetical protein
MLRLSRHFDQNPTLVGFLVATAVRMVAVDTTNLVLQSGPLPASAYAALESELAKHDVARTFQRMLPSARATSIQELGEMGSSIVGYFQMPAGKVDQSSQLELFDILIENATQPYGITLEKMAAVADQAGTLTELLAPALSATVRAVAKSQAEVRCLRILNALRSREQTGQTDEPKLADLGLPAEAITDPFSEKPLLLKKADNGWLVYSVGPDQNDDGGELGDYLDKDIGLAPPTSKADPDGNDK